MKRVTQLIMALTILVMMFAACGKKPVAEESSSAPESVAEESSEEESEEVPTHETPKEESSVQEEESEESKPQKPEKPEKEESSEQPEQGIETEKTESEVDAASLEIQGGSMLASAKSVLVNKHYVLHFTEDTAWFSFTTGPEQGAQYHVTLENLSPESKNVSAYMYEQENVAIMPTTRNNDYSPLHSAPAPFAIASPDGMKNSGMVDTLKPDTTYYLWLTGGGSDGADLLLNVSSPSMDTPKEEITVESEGSFSRYLMDQLSIAQGTTQTAAVSVPLDTTVLKPAVPGANFYAFTTTAQEGVPYYVTLVNRTVGQGDVDAWLIDLYGDPVDPVERNNDYNMYSVNTPICVAKAGGTANTGMVNNLKPSTTYCLYIPSDEEQSFGLRITTELEESTAFPTNSRFASAKKPLGEDDTYYAGTNQMAATMVRPNIRYYCTLGEGNDWISFTTGPDAATPYTITAQHLTAEANNGIHVVIVDEFGQALTPTERDNSYYAYAIDTPIAYPQPGGEENSGMIDTLAPETTYYLRISGDEGSDYMILIGEPEKTVEEEPAEEEAIFSVPFELNETQVRFVANQAIFLDEAAAKEALAPVAEVLLQHPGHPVLLAGTTAEVGSQEECAALSGQRAAAVKDLLVQEFDVPEDQLLTAGLGYEDDPFVRGTDWDANGNFVETEAAKNRRVIVIDAESEAAKKILE